MSEKLTPIKHVRERERERAKWVSLQCKIHPAVCCRNLRCTCAPSTRTSDVAPRSGRRTNAVTTPSVYGFPTKLRVAVRFSLFFRLRCLECDGCWHIGMCGSMFWGFVFDSGPTGRRACGSPKTQHVQHVACCIVLKSHILEPRTCLQVHGGGVQNSNLKDKVKWRINIAYHSSQNRCGVFQKSHSVPIKNEKDMCTWTNRFSKVSFIPFHASTNLLGTVSVPRMGNYTSDFSYLKKLPL